MGDGRVETPLHYQGERRVVTGTVKKKATKKNKTIIVSIFRISSKASFLLHQVSEFAVKKNTFSRQRLQIKMKLRAEICQILHAGPILHNNALSRL